MTRLLDIINPFFRCEIKPNENHFYFMFSIDVTGDLISGTKDLEEIHMYVGNPGSTVSSGICYSVTNQTTKLENFYFFFDAQKELDEIIAKVVCSAYIDSTKIDINRILWPEQTVHNASYPDASIILRKKLPFSSGSYQFTILVIILINNQKNQKLS